MAETGDTSDGMANRARIALDTGKTVVEEVLVHTDDSEDQLDNTEEVTRTAVDPMEVLGSLVRHIERISTPKVQAPVVNTLVTRFKGLKPEKFLGTADPAKAERWIQHLEDIFEVLDCSEVEKKKLAVFQLADDARNWWELIKSVIGTEKAQGMTWGEFKEKFLEKYFPAGERDEMEMAFMALNQGSMNVTEYQNRFEALSRFAPHLIGTPERRARKFTHGLVPSIRRMIVGGGRQMTYENVIETALAIEKDNNRFKKEMECEGKGRSHEASRGNQDREGKHAQKRQKMNHGGVETTSKGETSSPTRPAPKCYHCGILGHFARECTKPRVRGSTCFTCGESGHLARECKNPRKNFQPEPNAQRRL